MPSSLRRSTRKILIAIILCVINTYSRAHAARSSKQRTNRSTSFEVKPSKTSAQFNYNRTIAHKLSNVLEKEFEDYDEEEKKYLREREENKRRMKGVSAVEEVVSMKKRAAERNTVERGVRLGDARTKRMKDLIERTGEILMSIDEALSRERERAEAVDGVETLVDSEGNEYVLEHKRKSSMQTDSNLTRDIVVVFVMATALSLMFGMIAGNNRMTFHSAPSSDFVGFFLTGALVGPFSFRLVDEPVQLETLGEFGVIALCFSVGRLCDISVFPDYFAQEKGIKTRNKGRLHFMRRSSFIVLANVAVSSFIGGILGVATKIGVLKGIVIGAISVFDGSNSSVVVSKSSSVDMIEASGSASASFDASIESSTNSLLTTPQSSTTKISSDELNESGIMRWWVGVAFAVSRNCNTRVSFSQSFESILYALGASLFITFGIAARMRNRQALTTTKRVLPTNGIVEHLEKKYLVGDEEVKLVAFCAACLCLARLTEMLNLGYELGAFAFGIMCHDRRRLNYDDEQMDEIETDKKKKFKMVTGSSSDVLRAAHGLAFVSIGMNVRMSYLGEKFLALTLSSVAFILLVKKLRTFLRKEGGETTLSSRTMSESPTSEMKDIKSYSDVITLLLLKRSLFAQGISLNAYHFAFHTQVLCIFVILPLMEQSRRARSRRRAVKNRSS